MKREHRGATLVELLVVVGVFAVLMTLVLGFYLYGVRISQKRDGDSDRYRRAVTVLNKLETRLSTAWVYGVTEDKSGILYSPAETLQLEDGRVQRPTATHSLLIKNEELICVMDQQEQLIAKLAQGESLSFEAGPFGQTPDYLDIRFEVPPNSQDQKPITLTRRILIEGF